MNIAVQTARVMKLEDSRDKLSPAGCNTWTDTGNSR